MEPLQCKAGAGSICYGGTNNGNAPNIGQYPRMHVMPSGLLMMLRRSNANVQSWNPADGRWNKRTQLNYYRHYGASFLLPLHNGPI